ncbi:MAG: LysM peptidoglycan-binding domain-containing protein [Planctomycetes bacterium]|nr:LysM peptidoglycan-binding domain-containing protein [Planctomycetota bacterium]
MRPLLGWLLLLAICGYLAHLQTREPSSVRAEEAAPADTIEGRELAWRRLTVGRPSGAPPLELGDGWWTEEAAEELPPEATPLAEEDAVDPVAPHAAPQPRVFVYTVRAGDVLSRLCEERYGTGRPPVPQRVAEYNGLSSPDAVRAGTELRLPPWDVLFPEGRER